MTPSPRRLCPGESLTGQVSRDATRSPRLGAVRPPGLTRERGKVIAPLSARVPGPVGFTPNMLAGGEEQVPCARVVELDRCDSFRRQLVIVRCSQLVE